MTGRLQGPKAPPALLAGAVLIAMAATSNAASPAAAPSPDMREHVDRIIEPLMSTHGIPGMAVAVVTQGGAALFNYGLASKESGKPVDDQTLFEVGSLSKTLTATFAAYAAVKGKLSLADPVSRHMPELAGAALGDVPLWHLATHTPGGMPLQFPDSVTNEAQMLRYFQEWKPGHPPGVVRTYANPGIGLLGSIAARSLGQPYAQAMQREFFPMLGMQHTYLEVPGPAQADYAQGYTRQDQPARVSPGVLDDEAYGVKTTAADMARFVRASLGLSNPPADMQRAIRETHKGYFRIGAMTQSLIWEQYAYPVSLDALLAGNSVEMALEPQPVAAIDPPLPPQADAWVNKTGSTNGFGAYVAFVPARQAGVVLLANKNYPIPARVEAALRIMSAPE